MPQVYLNYAKKAIAGALLLLAPLSVSARVPNDPGYEHQKRLWQQINAPAAWDITIGSPNSVVAVIDTGADIWHPDLSGNVWTNPYEIPDNGIDDDHNGYKDDIHGWNFVEDNSNLHSSASATDAGDDESSMVHGTVIAGLVGAVGNNNTDVVGLNWNVKIMPLRAIQSNGSGKYSAVIKAIEYATVNGANVISMSFEGDEPSPKLEEALYRAYEKGVVIVAAAGNHDRNVSGNFDDTPRYPACFNQNRSTDWLLTVGSVNEHDVLSSFSNYGRCLSIVAPGENIVSTDWYAPAQGYVRQVSGPWAGTSFAAPLVAGTAALIKSIHPEWSAHHIIQTIRSTADSVDTVNNPPIGVGRLNVGAAVAAAVSADPRPMVWHRPLYAGVKSTVNTYLLEKKSPSVALSLPGATVLSVARARHDPGEYIFVLYKRGARLYLRTLTATGALLHEKNISPPANVGTAYTAVTIAASIDSAASPVVLVNWLDKKKQTTIQVIAPTGVVRAAHRFTYPVVAWAYDGASEEFFAARATPRGTVLEVSNWNSGAVNSISIGTAGAPDMVSLIGNTVAVTAHSAQEAQLVLVDRVTNGVTTHTLASGAKMPAWYLWPVETAHAITDAVIAFPLGRAGNRSVYDMSGTVVGSAFVPAVQGVVR